ncbi:Putative transcription initiation factor TAFII31, histone-fold [Septoria linicola]|uniref:Transcription initiation factor TAFII31, histone-fold n=1 Tax=Septoria linicola TaxID=215465 RepID=A0A9Q9EJ75_9PEZI|nr:putative transcription initiation factor TAFII31, histone-fold [Septoria linicola]USW52725.1 Putative transcription initiation factor TAFII31, histone-fold [Septoria linicola]
MATNGQPTPPPSDQPTNTSAKTAAAADPAVPLTSAQDDGTAKRPRDARLIHAVLSNYGITTYQERVPLQLLDFAYRYTSGILSDSLRLASEGYTNVAPITTGRGKGAAGSADEGEKITVTSLRQAIAARQGYTFQGALPKEFLLSQAMERNRIALPTVGQSYGVQLPPEKYCLTGVGWNMKEEWEDEVEEDERFGAHARAAAAPGMERSASSQKKGSAAPVEDDEAMGGMEGAEDEDEEGAGSMEDVFGEDAGGDVTMGQD